MIVTRYFQSCLLIEDEGVRILLDPSGQEKSRLAGFGQLDGVFYTHEHSDHFDAVMARDFVEQGIARVYANASTSKLINASKTIVQDAQSYDIKGMKISTVELPHCLMVDGSQGPQNTGYLINQKFFHPGDSVGLNRIKVDNLALPISGPDISLKDAYGFTLDTAGKLVIPIHYDFLGGNPEFLGRSLIKQSVKLRILNIGESIEC